MTGSKKITYAGVTVFTVSLLITVFFIFMSLFFDYVNNPVIPGDNKGAVVMEISKGSSFSAVMDLLDNAGLLKNRRFFYLLAMIKGAPTNIRTGEYEFTGSMSPGGILDKLLRGEVKGYRIPIPEGFTVDQIASRLSIWRLADKQTFVTLSRDREFLKALSISGVSLEGYLFPDTYLLTRSMGEREIIEFMVRRFHKEITPEMVHKANELGFTLEQIVTLASIIEKEGGLSEEKPLIAAVFHNRLKRGMRLQSDPTVIYGLKHFDGNLRKRDLSKKTPFNTYRIKGLPPSPICNPGLDSIKAALYPAPVDYLFFVSKNNGSHHFSSDLAAHNKAVIKYQIKRQR